MFWDHRRGRLDVEGRPAIMGILNATPDSFSDGGLHTLADSAMARCLEMLDAGADIIDIGGESTRPGAEPVPADIEISRVVPIISALRKERPTCVISVDTMKCSVAMAAVDAGADIINDVSGLRHDSGMAATAAKSGAGLVLMHMRGEPRTMQSDTIYGDLLGDILDFLRESIQLAVEMGMPRSRIAVDPGIGFGKTAEQNLALLAGIRRFSELGCLVLAGPSRKSFIGHVIGETNPARRLWGTAGAVAWLAARQIDVIRVHDVSEMRQVVDVVAAILRNHPKEKPI